MAPLRSVSLFLSTSLFYPRFFLMKALSWGSFMQLMTSLGVAQALGDVDSELHFVEAIDAVSVGVDGELYAGG